MTITSLWDGIEDAEIFERGKYVEANFKGIVEVTKTLAKPTRKSGVAFIVEMRVVETNMSDVHPVGQRVTWFQGLRDKDVAFPAIKAWIAIACGYQLHEKEKIDEEVSPNLRETLKIMTDSPDDNAFIGTKFWLETYHKKTKNDRDFTVHDWTLIPEES